MLVLDDCELVDGEPIVAANVLKVDDANLGPTDRTATISVLDSNSIYQHVME